MNPSDERFFREIRHLASASPQGAPPELGAWLKGAFARHHARRRQKRIALLATVAVVLLISLTWLRIWKHVRADTAAQNPAVQTSPAAPAVAARTAASPRIAPRVTRSDKHTRTVAKNRKPANPAPAASVAGNDFVALPSFDPAIPVGQSRIVRLELPGSALQLVGYPVNEELLEHRVWTDILVGQDGLPYAVRLVQIGAIH
jgi:hypothetical protein